MPDIVISLNIKKKENVPFLIGKEDASQYEQTEEVKQKGDCNLHRFVVSILSEGYVLRRAYWIESENQWHATKNTVEYVFAKNGTGFEKRLRKMVQDELLSFLFETKWRTSICHDLTTTAIVIKADGRQMALSSNVISVEDLRAEA